MTRFEITCECGEVLRGERTARGRIASCPSCQREVVVFPVSAWAVAQRSPPGQGHSPWRVPVLAALITLAAVALGLTLFFLYLRPSSEPSSPDLAELEDELWTKITRGRAHLRRGNHLLAGTALEEALRIAEEQPTLLSQSDRKQLEQWYREARVLAPNQLSDRSLEEIVAEGQRVGDAEEWALVFRGKFAGRSVVFEDEIFPEPKGGYRLGHYRVIVRGKVVPVRLPFKLFEGLGLKSPRRYLFAARLKSVRREEGGRWVIRMEPGSGVLLTEEEAVARLGLAPLSEELRSLLRRQTAELGLTGRMSQGE